jgi:ADP-heptose:LPS heptosyltransferase
MIPLRIPHYASMEELAPILTIDGIDFINLQSHECDRDIAEARERYGVDIHAWKDIDLRNDLNGVAALTSCLDLVISFPTFSSEFAGALGVPTVCFVNHKENLDQLGTEDAVWYPHTHYVSKTRTEPWQGVLDKIAEIARTKLGL